MDMLSTLPSEYNDYILVVYVRPQDKKACEIEFVILTFGPSFNILRKSTLSLVNNNYEDGHACGP